MFFFQMQFLCIPGGLLSKVQCKFVDHKRLNTAVKRDPFTVELYKQTSLYFPHLLLFIVDTELGPEMGRAFESFSATLASLHSVKEYDDFAI